MAIGKTGGFMVAGPSKGPDRNRKNNNVEFRSLSLLRFDIRHSIFEIVYQHTGKMHTPVFVKLLLPHWQSPDCGTQLTLRLESPILRDKPFSAYSSGRQAPAGAKAFRETD
jgi:hypothetical protein